MHTPDPRRIISEERTDTSAHMEAEAERRLAGWILRKVKSWEDYRDEYVAKRWGEYYRLWKGEWDTSLKSRSSERSRLISPALQQAIDSGVAEISEAVFGKGDFFDVDVPKGQEPSRAMTLMRANLSDDMKLADVRSRAEEIFLTACLFGTGIGKLSVAKEAQFELLVANPAQSAEQAKRTMVRLTPVHPAQFAIDPSATSVDDALGMAHIFDMPKHTILDKMRGEQPLYFSKPLGSAPNAPSSSVLPELNNLHNNAREDTTHLIEYHGKVPRVLLAAVQELHKEDGKEIVELFPEDKKEPAGENMEYDEADDLVEAIVTIANDSVVLRADENPLWMKDRAFIAFPYEKVPGKFWGRGIAEKAYNPQKALDAELRGRIDAMAYSIHPMAAMDASKLPPGFKFEVYPGKTLLTSGPPGNAIQTFNFTGPSPASFSQSGDLERMVQMATGTPDTSASMSQNPRNSTLGGMSIIAAGVLKRTKRVLANIERLFMGPLVKKIAWRYMQFDPARYPAVEARFRVFTTLGIMARELEQQQVVQLLSTSQPGTPIYFLLLKGIYENSSLANKEVMLLLLDQMAKQAQQPNPDQQLARQRAEVELRDKIVQRSLENRRVAAEELRAIAEAHKTGSSIVLEQAKAVAALAQAESEKVNHSISGLAQLVEAQAAQADAQLPNIIGASNEQANSPGPGNRTQGV